MGQMGQMGHRRLWDMRKQINPNTLWGDREMVLLHSKPHDLFTLAFFD